MATPTLNQIGAWAERRREQLKAAGKPVHLPALAREALRSFKPDFWALFAQENGYEIIYEFLKRFFMPSAAGVSARASGLRPSVFAYLREWSEDTGEGKHFLFTMTREELSLAILRRKARAITEWRVAQFLEAIRERVKGHKRVENVWTASELHVLHEKIVKSRDATSLATNP